MKKLVLFLILLLIPFSIGAEKKEVKFSKCVDGDTVKIILNGKETTVRMLAIDTPETKHPKKGKEPFGQEASDYTCDSLKKANNITVEYDKGSDKKDKYNRELVWIWVDNNLHQKNLIKKGYAKVAYLYGDYKYTKELEFEEQKAKDNKLGIWGEYKEEDNTIYIIVAIIIVIILLLISPKYRKKTKSKINRTLKKNFNKELKKYIS
jgi:Micrococcal nuclease (thermonuclease) homologs